MRNDTDPKPAEPVKSPSDAPKPLGAVEKPDVRGTSDELADDDLDKVSGGMFEMNKHLS